MMKKTLALLLALALVLTLFGCQSAPAPEQTQTADGETFDYASATAVDLLATLEDSEHVTVDEYAWLISTLENVAISDDLTLEDNITFEALDMLYNSEAELPEDSDVIDALIDHDAPQVRGYVMSYMGGLFGTSEEEVSTVLELLEDETEPFVLKCAIQAVANEGNANADVAAFLLDMAKHDHAKVRYHAALALGNSWSDQVDGAAETLIVLMNDSDTAVREVACEYSGKLNDESVIAPLVAILNDPAEYDLHDECLEGLLTLWLDYPFHENASESAYRATVNYYNTVAFTENTPPWNAISSTKNIASDGLDEWKTKASFYQPSELITAMTRIIQSPDVNWLARTAAIDVIAAHGTKTDLEALAPIIDALSDDDADFVKNSYESALAE